MEAPVLGGDAGGELPARQDRATREVAKTDPARAAYLKAVANENCEEGYVWRAGDAANLSIGQGNVMVTPLQLVRAYAAIANGGKLHVPRIGVAVVGPDGRLVQEIDAPKPKRISRGREGPGLHAQGARRGADGGHRRRGVLRLRPEGSGWRARPAPPNVCGKKDMSWFASFGPAKEPRYAVVAMVSQAGFGAQTSAPIVRKIWEAMYGLTKDDEPVLDDGKLPTGIPRASDGSRRTAR